MNPLPKRALRFASNGHAFLPAPVIAMVCAILVAPPCARAGAWTQAPGSLYARLTYAGITSQTRFDAGGARVDLTPRFTFAAQGGATEYRAREARAYAEYGLVERFTAYGSITLKRVVMDEPAVSARARCAATSTSSNLFGILSTQSSTVTRAIRSSLHSKPQVILTHK